MRVNYYQLTESELAGKVFSEGTFYYCTDSKTFYFDPIGQNERVSLGLIADSALSTSSTNTVQNKIITNALNSKAPSTHNHNALNITGGTFAGLVAQNRNGGTTVHQQYIMRNSILTSNAESTPTYNGEISWVYE